MLVNNRRVLCGEVFDFVDDPAIAGEQSYRYFAKGALVIVDGKIAQIGDQAEILPSLDSGFEVHRYDNSLIMPGLIDTHIHFPQTEMIASYGERLLEWLENYAFPTEKKFKDYAYGRSVAKQFLNELLRNGTTTALVFGTVHPQSVDAFFDEAQQRKLRMIAGKVLMDKHCPAELSDTPELAYQQSKELIEKWHGKDRLNYAVTPRFAPTCSPEQLASCEKLLAEYPDVYLQTHISENQEECAWVDELYPDCEDYLGVYEKYNLVRKRSVFAHGIHLNDREVNSMAGAHAAVSHCPTSNLFLGSGLFDLKGFEQHQVPVGIATDVGGGTSFSLLQTCAEAYKIQQLRKENFSAFKGFYLATLGGARALDLEDSIGSFAIGNEADCIVLDYQATSALAFRTKEVQSLHDKLFAVMMLGDDRCIKETRILGELAFSRDAENQFS